MKSSGNKIKKTHIKLKSKKNVIKTKSLKSKKNNKKAKINYIGGGKGNKTQNPVVVHNSMYETNNENEVNSGIGSSLGRKRSGSVSSVGSMYSQGSYGFEESANHIPQYNFLYDTQGQINPMIESKSPSPSHYIQLVNPTEQTRNSFPKYVEMKTPTEIVKYVLMTTPELDIYETPQSDIYETPKSVIYEIVSNGKFFNI